MDEICNFFTIFSSFKALLWVNYNFYVTFPNQSLELTKLFNMLLDVMIYYFISIPTLIGILLLVIPNQSAILIGPHFHTH